VIYPLSRRSGCRFRIGPVSLPDSAVQLRGWIWLDRDGVAPSRSVMPIDRVSPCMHQHIE